MCARKRSRRGLAEGWQKEPGEEEVLWVKDRRWRGPRFPCNQCKYVASRQTNLNNHKASKHEGVMFMDSYISDYFAKNKLVFIWDLEVFCSVSFYSTSLCINLKEGLPGLSVLFRCFILNCNKTSLHLIGEKVSIQGNCQASSNLIQGFGKCQIHLHQLFWNWSCQTGHK